MARGKGKRTRQPEKILVLLLSAKGKEVSLDEIVSTLGAEIHLYRLSTYLWNLKVMGAEIIKRKVGRKLVGFTLGNFDTMLTYAQGRGFIAPPPVVLSSADLLA